jgi:hypothetical protein
MPWLIAESACAEGSRFLGLDLPARYAVWLEVRAEVSYARFRHFRKLMRRMDKYGQRLSLIFFRPGCRMVS